MFDIKEDIEVEPQCITALMEQLDVFISIKPKPKQPSKVWHQALTHTARKVLSILVDTSGNTGGPDISSGFITNAKFYICLFRPQLCNQMKGNKYPLNNWNK